MVVSDGAAVQRMINYVAACHGEISVAEIFHFSAGGKDPRYPSSVVLRLSLISSSTNLAGSQG